MAIEDDLARRWEEARVFLDDLVQSRLVRMATITPSVLPTNPGVYAIWDAEGECLGAGRTDASLRQRVYKNHLMGDQGGNLLAQLVADPETPIPSLAAAKLWVRQHCAVRWMVVDDPGARVRGEHVLLAILHPRYQDRGMRRAPA